MLYDMHYAIGASFEPKEKRQGACEKRPENYRQMYRDYPCVGIKHQRADILLSGIPRPVVKVRKEVVDQEKQSRQDNESQFRKAHSPTGRSGEGAGHKKY